MLSILVSIFLFDLSLFSILEFLVTATKELRIKLELESKLDLVSFEVLIVSELKFKLIKISIRILRIAFRLSVY
jgi:hypothetical protein